MTKTEAINLFGETGAELGDALGLSRSRISQLPDVLTQEQTDRVMGAALRLGKIKQPTAGKTTESRGGAVHSSASPEAKDVA